MKFGLAKKTDNGTVFEESCDPVIRDFCSGKRRTKHSECLKHYQVLWDEHDTGQSIEKLACPYGLVTTSAIGSASKPIALTGFWIRGTGNPLAPEDVIERAVTEETTVNNLTRALSEVSAGIRAEELEHFEAALHDTRHLNHAITQNAELILKRLGWEADAVWDMQEIQKDEHARRALTIYAASRDLSLAILMHEISRDISQATRDVSSQQVHKLFYRQIKISSARMEAANVTCSLGASNKTLQLSKAFRVVPKILLDNAIKYSTRGSQIQILLTETLSNFVIEVRNNGPVIRENEVSDIFKRGIRGSNRSGIQGQGIGLWLAETITKANHGRIEFQVRGTGRDYSGRMLGTSIVTIKLPL
jgi:signal transduction histidine kinase